MELKDMRDEIDRVDDGIAELFIRRMEIVEKVADYKRLHKLPIVAPEREREILFRVTGLAGEGLENEVRTLFATLFDISGSRQRRRLSPDTPPLKKMIRAAVRETPERFPTRATVACQGVEGAYSQQACDKLFPTSQILYFSNFEGVFQAVESGMCRYGILPIENSTAGSVTAVYDLMVKYHFFIVRSLKLKIEHQILAKPGVSLKDIRELVSHEQALAQCSDFIKHNPQIGVTVAGNTAAAAQQVAQSDRTDLGSISSAHCAELYGLSVLMDSVQDSEHNYTRFICISKQLEIYPDSRKITFMASVAHKPGSLYRLIARFSAQGINISKIESRPIAGKDFEFRFYFDIEASVCSEETLDLLSQMENDEYFVFLGNYHEQH